MQFNMIDVNKINRAVALGEGAHERLDTIKTELEEIINNIEHPNLKYFSALDQQVRDAKLRVMGVEAQRDALAREHGKLKHVLFFSWALIFVLIVALSGAT